MIIKRMLRICLAVTLILMIAMTSFAASDSWQQDDYGWWYLYDDGTFPQGTWLEDGGVRYYFGNDGYMWTGWVFDNGNWYYMNPSGAMAVGWVFDNGNWYYMSYSGEMCTGWILDGSSWYYMDSSGAMTTGWIFDDGNWYYMSSSGEMCTGWIWDGSAWYYIDPSGEIATGWLYDGLDWYYMLPSGEMCTGWIWDGDSWYYMNPSGAMAVGWVYDGYDWYYMSSLGEMYTGWLAAGADWYYFLESGQMATGKTLIDGIIYFFDDSGKWTGAARGNYEDDALYDDYAGKVLSAINRTPTTDAGLCASWVSQVMMNAGILTYNLASLRDSALSYAAASGLANGEYAGDTGFNANDYWAYVCYSRNLEDLAAGMVIASRNSYSYLGRQFGHVGIYIGDNQVISSIGYLEKTSLDEWIQTYNNEEMGSAPAWGYLPY